MAAKKLLVADDSLTIQKVIRLALSGAAGGAGDGYDIQAVSDGNDAIQQISLFRPDVVLIDVSLPGRSAFEVKRAINEHKDLEDVRFVLMSSAFEKVDEQQASEVGFHGRLTKPFDPAHLREVLTQVLSQPRAEDRSRMLSKIDMDGPTVFLNPEDSAMPAGTDDTDIRNLTESTIRMSGLASADLETTETFSGAVERATSAPPAFPVGEQPAGLGTLHMDDFQWSIQEHVMKPPPGILDSGDSSFLIPGGRHGDLPPVPEQPPFPVSPPPSTIPLSRSTQQPARSQQEGSSMAQPPAPAGHQPEMANGRSANVQVISASDMEEIIRGEVEKVLQKMAEKVLPDIAEKLIKQEIRKMLNEG